MFSKLSKFRKIISNCRYSGLNFDDTFHYDLSDVDIESSGSLLPGFCTPRELFLGRFTKKNLVDMMERVGLVKYLDSIGFNELIVDVSIDENRISYLKIFHCVRSPERQLIDLRLSESPFIPDRKFFPEGEKIIPYSMIAIEWVSSRNPDKTFDSENPQLPGQSCPGLGALKYLFEIFYIISKFLFKDGFMDVPDHMSGAIIYSKKYKFFDPVVEGEVRAVERDLKKYSLADIAWGVITGSVIDRETGLPAVYTPSEQIYYVSERMRSYFHSRKYVSAYRETFKKKKFYLDFDEMVSRREVILQSRRIEDL